MRSVRVRQILPYHLMTDPAVGWARDYSAELKRAELMRIEREGARTVRNRERLQGRSGVRSSSSVRAS